MGKTKIVCLKTIERLNGELVILYIMQETTITLDKENKIPILKYIAPYWTANMLNKEMAENGPIDPEYFQMMRNSRKFRVEKRVKECIEKGLPEPVNTNLTGTEELLDTLVNNITTALEQK